MAASTAAGSSAKSSSKRVATWRTTPPAKTMAGTYATYDGSWRMTSSPGSHVARSARSTASDAPTVTSSSVAGS